MFKALPLIICPCSVKDGGDGFHPCSVKDGGVNVGDCKREGAGEDGGGEVGKDITQITTSEWRNGGIETGITGRKEEWIHMDGNGRREAKTSAGHKKVDGARDGSGRTSLPDMVHKNTATLVCKPGITFSCGSALFINPFYKQYSNHYSLPLSNPFLPSPFPPPPFRFSPAFSWDFSAVFCMKGGRRVCRIIMQILELGGRIESSGRVS